MTSYRRAPLCDVWTTNGFYHRLGPEVWTIETPGGHRFRLCSFVCAITLLTAERPPWDLSHGHRAAFRALGRADSYAASGVS